MPSDFVFSRKILERNYYKQVQITKETKFKEPKESMMAMNQHKNVGLAGRHSLLVQRGKKRKEILLNTLLSFGIYTAWKDPRINNHH